MAQRMEKRPSMEGGMIVLPRTRTSRVPIRMVDWLDRICLMFQKGKGEERRKRYHL